MHSPSPHHRQNPLRRDDILLLRIRLRPVGVRDKLEIRDFQRFREQHPAGESAVSFSIASKKRNGFVPVDQHEIDLLLPRVSQIPQIEIAEPEINVRFDFKRRIALGVGLSEAPMMPIGTDRESIRSLVLLTLYC